MGFVSYSEDIEERRIDDVNSVPYNVHRQSTDRFQFAEGFWETDSRYEVSWEQIVQFFCTGQILENSN